MSLCECVSLCLSIFLSQATSGIEVVIKMIRLFTDCFHNPFKNLRDTISNLSVCGVDFYSIGFLYKPMELMSTDPEERNRAPDPRVRFKIQLISFLILCLPAFPRYCAAIFCRTEVRQESVTFLMYRETSNLGMSHYAL